jgi:hypothetical protein
MSMTLLIISFVENGNGKNKNYLKSKGLRIDGPELPGSGG